MQMTLMTMKIVKPLVKTLAKITMMKKMVRILLVMKTTTQVMAKKNTNLYLQPLQCKWY